ncbi:hypothetical protein D3C73_1237350 [compost metagenome]
MGDLTQPDTAVGHHSLGLLQPQFCGVFQCAFAILLLVQVYKVFRAKFCCLGKLLHSQRFGVMRLYVLLGLLQRRMDIPGTLAAVILKLIQQLLKIDLCAEA